MGRDEYLKTLMSAYDMAINWKVDVKGPGVAPHNGVAFATESDNVDVHAANGIKMTRLGNPLICHLCGNNHYANKCPDRKRESPRKNREV